MYYKWLFIKVIFFEKKTLRNDRTWSKNICWPFPCPKIRQPYMDPHREHCSSKSTPQTPEKWIFDTCTCTSTFKTNQCPLVKLLAKN